MHNHRNVIMQAVFLFGYSDLGANVWEYKKIGNSGISKGVVWGGEGFSGFDIQSEIVGK